MSTRAASPVVVAARHAVAHAVADLAEGTVIVACSGGADSLTLAAAAAWVAPRTGLTAHAVVVDHALQAGSREVAEQAARTCVALGLSDAQVVTVSVGGPGGPEAAARAARHAALESAAVDLDAGAILLGHTREDQAETVLLRLARGSGARSLAGMRRRSGPWRRPFLDLPRADVRAAAHELLAPLGITPWEDPHNSDPAFARVRVRALLADLEKALGPSAVLGLVRTADLLNDDADALDAAAAVEARRCVVSEGRQVSAACDALQSLPRAIRTRVLRSMSLSLGSPPDALTWEHVQRIEALVSDWHGQGEVSLPGGVIALRACGRLCLRAAT